MHDYFLALYIILVTLLVLLAFLLKLSYPKEPRGRARSHHGYHDQGLETSTADTTKIGTSM